jgi:hypothetical protein
MESENSVAAIKDALTFLQFLFFLSAIEAGVYLSLIFVQQRERAYLHRMLGYGYIILANIVGLWMIFSWFLVRIH